MMSKFQNFILIRLMQMLLNKLELKINDYLINNFDKLKINSKEIEKGDVFAALKGNNHHGNNFIEEAVSNGAKYIISDKEIIGKNFHNFLQVKDIFLYLSIIASKKRNMFNGKIIAITGSIGKTSVKENLNFFLSTQGIVSFSIKSYNNFLGVLISLINLNLHSIFAIFEIGTNNFNEVKKLTSMITPHQVIITNIFPTHLLNFKNTRNIAIEKSDLYNPKFNPNIELLILPNLNEDEIYLKELSKKYKINSVITFGKKNDADYFIQNIEIINNFSSRLKIRTPHKLMEFKVSTSFEHQIFNVIISLIIFIYNKLNINSFLINANNIPFVAGRGLFHKLKINDNHLILIDESYNASPISIKNCIIYFKNFVTRTNQRKILILGEMNELGESAFDYHKEIVIFALKTNINKIIFCGYLYNKILNKIKFDSKKVFCLFNELEIIKLLKNITHNNDIILAKGSNSTKINILVKKLLETEIKY